MTVPEPRTLLLAVALLLGAGGLWFSIAGREAADRSCPNGQARMGRIELVLGMSRKGRPDVTDAEWQAFLAREVTPRFPDGLTVIQAQGQWRGADGVAIREPSRVLLVWSRPAADLDARLEAIRDGWKRAHAQESVLLARGWDCVSF
jgi:hypothetical protein